MTALWSIRPPGPWQSHMLDGDVVSLVAVDSDTDRHPLPESLAPAADAVLLRRVRVDGSHRWVLLAGARVRVRRNGGPVTAGLSVLADRDEIVVADAAGNAPHRFFFSTESVARVESAPEQLAGTCPRCKTRIESGSLAVSCPHCGVWHHQIPTRPCWTYSARCAACHHQPTELDGQLHWTPAEI